MWTIFNVGFGFIFLFGWVLRLIDGGIYIGVPLTLIGSLALLYKSRNNVYFKYNCAIVGCFESYWTLYIAVLLAFRYIELFYTLVGLQLACVVCGIVVAAKYIPNPNNWCVTGKILCSISVFCQALWVPIVTLGWRWSWSSNVLLLFVVLSLGSALGGIPSGLYGMHKVYKQPPPTLEEEKLVPHLE